MVEKTIPIRRLLHKQPKTTKYREKLWKDFSDFERNVKNPTNNMCQDNGQKNLIQNYHYLEIFMFLYDTDFCEFYRKHYCKFIQVLSRIPYPSKDGFIGYDSFLGKLIFAAAKVLDWATDINHPEIFKNLRPGSFFSECDRENWFDGGGCGEFSTLLEPSKRMIEIMTLVEFMIETIFSSEIRGLLEDFSGFYWFPSETVEEFQMDIAQSVIRKLKCGDCYMYYKKGRDRVKKETRLNLYKNMQLIVLDLFAKRSKPIWSYYY